MKYTYKVNLPKMEEIYFGHTQKDFFNNDKERQKFNVTVVVEADSEEESEKMRIGMSDIRMWELASIE